MNILCCRDRNTCEGVEVSNNYSDFCEAGCHFHSYQWCSSNYTSIIGIIICLIAILIFVIVIAIFRRKRCSQNHIMVNSSQPMIHHLKQQRYTPSEQSDPGTRLLH